MVGRSIAWWMRTRVAIIIPFAGRRLFHSGSSSTIVDDCCRLLRDVRRSVHDLNVCSFFKSVSEMRGDVLFRGRNFRRRIFEGFLSR